jgi:hypothetical protein
LRNWGVAAYNRPVKKWTIVLTSFAGVCMVGICLVCYVRGPEPRYGGKSLSWWLLSDWGWANIGKANTAQTEALSKMGTNSIPFLVDWVAYERPVSRFKVFSSAAGLDLRDTRSELARASIRGFEVLGADGGPAIPDLVRLTKGTNVHVALRALMCIEATGEAGIPIVFDVLTNRQAYCADSVFSLMGTMSCLGTNVELVIPGLVECLRNPNPRAAAMGAVLLGQIGKRPEIVVPALERCFGAQDEGVRYCAVYTIGGFHESARSAVPALIRAMSDSAAPVRNAATNSLRRVAPEVLGREKER